jgi:hypothetical protein
MVVLSQDDLLTNARSMSASVSVFSLISGCHQLEDGSKLQQQAN